MDSSSTTEPALRRWRIDLEYDGADFDGWQLQPRGRTVQGVVETALEALLRHPVRVRAAGRTDAGVHALQQVICVDSAAVRTPHQMRAGLNGLLPDDVACTVAAVVNQEFDPRYSSHQKQYRYRWLDRPTRSPLRRGCVRWVRGILDEEAMDRAVAALVGTHDFTSFRARKCSAKDAIRTIAAASVRREDGEVVLRVEGTGFLRHMVRIIAGTLEDIGLGRQRPETLREVLRARDRLAAGRTAPPHGLTLMWIAYSGE